MFMEKRLVKLAQLFRVQEKKKITSWIMEQLRRGQL